MVRGISDALPAMTGGHAWVAWILADEGDLAAASARIDRVADDDFGALARNPFWHLEAVFFGQAAAACGHARALAWIAPAARAARSTPCGERDGPRRLRPDRAHGGTARRRARPSRRGDRASRDGLRGGRADRRATASRARRDRPRTRAARTRRARRRPRARPRCGRARARPRVAQDAAGAAAARRAECAAGTRRRHRRTASKRSSRATPAAGRCPSTAARTRSAR